MSASTLVAVGRGWTPEEAARHEAALYRSLASDKKALRVYLQKVRAVEMVRAKVQQVTLLEADTKKLDKAAAVAGGRSSSSSGQPLGAASESRVRRRKSPAQREKSVKKLQHKKLQSRCEAAATKAGGSSPKILARVLACCGRFRELQYPEGAERMWRLRQVEAEAKAAAAAADSGLNAMRVAVAAATAPTPMAEDNPIPHNPKQAQIERPGLLVDRGHGARKEPARKEPPRFGSAATTVTSPGAGAEDWPKVGESRSARVSLHGRPPCG